MSSRIILGYFSMGRLSGKLVENWPVSWWPWKVLI